MTLEATAALPVERDPEERLETLGAEVCALGLPSRRHSLLAKRIYDQFERQLPGTPWAAYPSGLGVHVESKDGPRHTIPDVTVFCGELKGHPNDPDVLLNPSVIVEVLSLATYHRDHVQKRIAYCGIESLKAYLIVDQDQALVTTWGRSGPGRETWEPSIRSRGALEVPGTGLSLDLEQLYANLGPGEA